MNLTTKIVGSIVVAGGIATIATPMIYQKQIDNAIQTQVQLLSKKNIIIDEKNINDSFFNVKREYILTITNIAPFIKDIYPNIDFYTLQQLKETFDNTKFLVSIDMSKYPINHKEAIKISLYKLNNTLTKDLEKDFTGKEIIKFIQNKGLELILDTDSTKITKIKLKDIDLKLQSPNLKEKLEFKIQNAYSKLADKISINVDKISFDLSTKSDLISLKFNKIHHVLKKQNEFNYQTNSHIQNITYSLKKPYSNIIANIDDISLSSNVHSIVNNLNLKNSLNVKNLKISSNNDYIQLKNFTFNNKLEKLDLVSIKTIANIVKNSQKLNNTQILKPLQTLINKGFNFKIEPLSFDSAKINILNNSYNISKFNLQFNTKLNTNNYNFNSQNINVLLNYITANLHITTTKENIDLLTKLNPMSTLYLGMVSTQNKNIVEIDISYKNGEFLSNGKRIK